MLTYRQSGVDIDAGNELVRRIRGMESAIGGFAGLLDIDEKRQLVMSTDGVGTKLALAIEMDRLESIGQDLVAMCVNDVITVGAKPLGFLDYYATGRLDVDRAERVVQGIADACRMAGCRLMGGETAEMPGFYPEGKFDLAGFVVGLVDRDKVIDGRHIVEGDLLVGLPSSGVHSNGFSLVRLILERHAVQLDLPFEGSRTLGDVLLEPTVIYVTTVLGILERHAVKGIAHITGGGFENLDRVLPEGTAVGIHEGSWEIPPIFRFLQDRGEISDPEMRRTFNMGIGMVLVVEPATASKLQRDVPGSFVFGEIVRKS
jgi:phosphoribosylformylglycinamidine cyclo-ligase